MHEYLKLIRKFQSSRFAVLVGIIVALADFFSKRAVVLSMVYGETVNVIPCFNIVRMHNYGITFGVLDNYLSQSMIIIFVCAVVIFILFWAKQHKQYLPFITVIVFGAIGNVIDRIVYGYVVDFLDFYVNEWHWPAFNIADCAIVFCNFNILLMFLFDNNRDAT